jgi:hypothetical protein
MALAVWPATLPQIPLQDGNGLQAEPNRFEFQPDEGPAVRRRRYSAPLRRINWSLNLTAAQKTTFLTFYDATLGYGADRFTAPDPFAGGAAVFQIVGEYAMVQLDASNFRVQLQMLRVS